MIEKSEITAVGKFLKTHALKGELNAVFDLEAADIDPTMPLIVEMDGIYVPFYIASLRGKGQFASLVRLNGVESEQDARPFVNKIIYMRRDDVAQIDEEADPEEGGYADDFVGYTVKETDGSMLGTIEDVDISTSNTLFILADTQGNPLYIPVNDEWIVAIDSDQRTMTMSLPEGLINLNLKK